MLGCCWDQVALIFTRLILRWIDFESGNISANQYIRSPEKVLCKFVVGETNLMVSTLRYGIQMVHLCRNSFILFLYVSKHTYLRGPYENLKLVLWLKNVNVGKCEHRPENKVVYEDAHAILCSNIIINLLYPYHRHRGVLVQHASWALCRPTEPPALLGPDSTWLKGSPLRPVIAWAGWRTLFPRPCAGLPLLDCHLPCLDTGLV